MHVFFGEPLQQRVSISVLSHNMSNSGSDDTQCTHVISSFTGSREIKVEVVDTDVSKTNIVFDTVFLIHFLQN